GFAKKPARTRARSGSPRLVSAFSALARPQALAGGVGVRLDAVALDLGGHLQVALHGARAGEPRGAAAARVGLRAGHVPLHRILGALEGLQLAGPRLALARHPALGVLGVLLADAALEHAGLPAGDERRAGDGVELP